jgi:hypothetical protein
MEDAAIDIPEYEDDSVPVIAPASDDDLSTDDSERDAPMEITAGEDDVSSLDETYQYTSVTDSNHEDSSSNSDDDEAIEHLPSPYTTLRRPGGHGSAQGTEPLEPHIEVYPHAGFIKEEMLPEAFRNSAQVQSTLGAGNAYYPFANEIDFELGTWLHDSGLSRAKIDEFLKLKYVRQLLLLLPRLTIHRFEIGCLHSHMHQHYMRGSNSCQMADLGGSSNKLCRSMGTQ